LSAFQEHFFSESNGQIGYIQERLKRIRRSLAPEAHQRPRNRPNQPKRAVTAQSDEGKTIGCSLTFITFHFLTLNNYLITSMDSVHMDVRTHQIYFIAD